MSTTNVTVGRSGGDGTPRVQTSRRPAAAARDGWAPLAEQCCRIVAAHHDPLRARLPRLKLTLFKVADAHGCHHPELYRVLTVFARFADDLARHLGEEDHDLYPQFGRLEPGDHVPPCLRDRMAGLSAAHDRAAAALAELSALTGGFTAPADGCDTYRALMAELQDLRAEVRATVAEELEMMGACAGLPYQDEPLGV